MATNKLVPGGITMDAGNIGDEKISQMKIIVYKTLVDPSTAKLVGEREKLRLFTKMGLLKPKRDDIHFESLEKLYDPFFILNGKYFIDYYRKRVYSLDVEDDVSELLIFDRTFQPKTPKLAKFRGKARDVVLEAKARVIKENSAYLILDKKGAEVELQAFSTAPAEEEPNKVIAEAKERILNLEISPTKALELFRSHVVNRPVDVEQVNHELFEVHEYNLVYVPLYQATYQNRKTGEAKSLVVDGVTSNLLSRRIEKGVGTPKKLCSKCGQLNEEQAKYCRKCGQQI
jgi:hypothetical protein